MQLHRPALLKSLYSFLSKQKIPVDIPSVLRLSKDGNQKTAFRLLFFWIKSPSMKLLSESSAGIPFFRFLFIRSILQQKNTIYKILYKKFQIFIDS